jgi:hypothetical protein
LQSDGSCLNKDVGSAKRHVKGASA